jgi:hypothetical protein
MKPFTFINILLLPFLLLTGCGTSEEVMQSTHTISLHEEKEVTESKKEYIGNKNIGLPNQVDLTFENVTLKELKQSAPDSSWVNSDTYSFSQLNGKPISINVFESNDEFNDLYANIQYRDETYPLYFPIGFVGNEIEINFLKQNYSLNNETIHLIGSIGTSARGYQYIIYNEVTNKWFIFFNWGIPEVFDINHDGINEVLLQFQGMHLNPPNVNVLQVGENSFEIASIDRSLQNLIDDILLPVKISSTYKKQGNHILFDIYVMSLSETNTHSEGYALYQYNKGTLTKQ